MISTEHGGNIIQAAARIGCRPSDMVDMSSNLNPLGPPPGLLDYLKEKIHEICRLPEIDAASCVAAYAREYDIDPGTVLAEAGTTRFIYDLPRALDTRNALIIAPTYSDYARACRLHGARTFIWKTSAGHCFRPDLGQALSDHREIDTVFVCNPNNPTGCLLAKNELEAFCRNHSRLRLIVDESYLPFVPRGRRHSLVSAQMDNLLVLSSFSKIYQAPGLRIGFISGSPSLTNQLRAFQLPWSVNAMAQAAIVYLFGQAEKMALFVQKSRAFIEAEKRRCLPVLDIVSGLRIFSGPTPFVLVELPPGRTSSSVVKYFINQRILIRDCANFEGLGDRYIRFSIKDKKDNDRFVGMLKRLLNNEQNSTRNEAIYQKIR